MRHTHHLAAKYKHRSLHSVTARWSCVCSSSCCSDERAMPHASLSDFGRQAHPDIRSESTGLNEFDVHVDNSGDFTGYLYPVARPKSGRAC